MVGPNAKEACNTGGADGRCPVCGHAEADVDHLVWECPAGALIRESIHELDVLKQWLKDYPEEFEKFGKGVCTHPEQGLPPPARNGGVHFWAKDGEKEPKGHHFQGQIFTDGSAKPLIDVYVKRASWAVVSTGPAGEVVAVMRGPVRDPHTANEPVRRERCMLCCCGVGRDWRYNLQC